MINFFVGSAIAAKQEKAGMSKLGLLQQSLLILVKLFLQAIVKSSWRTSRSFRLNPERQVNTWQLVSVHINRQRSLDISTMKKKTLQLAHACAHSLAILSIQEAKSWDVPSLELAGCVCYGGKSGFATFCTIERSWKFEERCTAISNSLRDHPGDGSYTLQTQVKVWRCTRLVSQALLKFYEKDVGAELKTSTSQVISTWNWEWCVLTKKTSRNQKGCMVHFTGTDTIKILEASRNSSGTEWWMNSTARPLTRGPCAEE